MEALLTVLRDVGLGFVRIGLLAFGGGLGILPEMERLAVTAHGWVTHREFVDIFALSQVTPGPGMMMVMVIGLQAAGPLGALTAILAMFGPPSFLAAVAGDRWGRLAGWPPVQALGRALSPIALGLMVSGAYTLARSAVDGPVTVLLAAGALALMALTRLSALAVMGLAALGALLALR